MPFMNFFRNLFGGRNAEGPKNDGDSFRNPIWHNDEDDDDVDDFRRPRGDMSFSTFSDPLEITRFFESQMDEMLKSFFFGFGNGFMFSLPGHGESMDAPPQLPSQDKNLRDGMLKKDYGTLDSFNEQVPKEDTDLDGKISVDELSKIWSDRKETKEIQPFINRQYTVGRSVRKEFYRGADGSIEQKQIFKDSEGNEETIVTRQVGDKTYTVTTKRDKNGLETKTEDFVNMDENELTDFSEKWKPLGDGSRNPHNSILNQFPWEKFFEPQPKL